MDEQSKNEIKDILLTYDRTLLVADPRRCEPKKVRGRGGVGRVVRAACALLIDSNLLCTHAAVHVVTAL